MRFRCLRWARVWTRNSVSQLALQVWRLAVFIASKRPHAAQERALVSRFLGMGSVPGGERFVQRFVERFDNRSKRIRRMLARGSAPLRHA